MMFPKQLLLSTVLLISSLFAHAAEVPRIVTYCGMQIEFTDASRAKVQGYVDDILKSPRYFNEMVKRAHTYMPFIEEALSAAGAPDDLKYLSIQESALRPDVVSSSQAVGFWQFKEETARDFGLIVDDKVDERMHIYRSSEGAAKYLLRANQDFDNWVYAVMAYFHGFTGAIQYTDPKYYSTKRMVINDDLHWYPLKAIAHKLAYEEAVNLRQRPLVALIPYSTNGESIVKHLLEGHQGVDEESFFLYNKWIKDQRRLPKDVLFTYYIPQAAEFYTGHQEDPVRVQIANGGTPAGYRPREITGHMDAFGMDKPPVYEPQQVPDRPMTTPSNPSSTGQVAIPIGTMAGAFRALDPANMPGENYVVFETIYDLDYGKEYVIYNGVIGLPELAERLGVRLSQLLIWNNLTPSQRPVAGSLVYLSNPKNTEYHVVASGESIESIAKIHQMSTGKIIRNNRLEKDKPVIYIGQKLFLKAKRPKDEKIIILQHQEEKTVAANRPQPQTPREVPPRPAPVTQPVTPTTSPTTQPTAPNQPSSSWVIHEVKPGETLWQISQKYGTRVEIIKKVNNLESDTLKVGQVLKVLARN
ncbi:MAG: LysM peptidoglycan-binding domain-containing protein [Bacteroidia bacterium]|nr:LysM peptidoglycan-binding domain-containing protein [Bacteroidia bacterium]